MAGKSLTDVFINSAVVVALLGFLGLLVSNVSTRISAKAAERKAAQEEKKREDDENRERRKELRAERDEYEKKFHDAEEARQKAIIDRDIALNALAQKTYFCNLGGNTCERLRDAATSLSSPPYEKSTEPQKPSEKGKKS